jgi:hypothetical protein
MSDEWIGRIIVFTLSVALFVATELFFPLEDTAGPTAVRQKHFWATMLFIFSIILGLPLESSLRMEREVSGVKNELDAHDNQSTLHDRFHEIWDEYASIFSGVSSGGLAQDDNTNARRLLRAWGDILVDYLNADFKSGSIPIPLEQAPEKIKDVYSKAERSILATNVGGTKTYFDNQEYLNANKYAQTRHIPVIRFYLYDDERKRHILMRGDRTPHNIDDFYNEVKDLHKMMGTVYSAVIDVDITPDLDGYRDLLLMDNAFLAETRILQTTWDPIRAEATINQNRIQDAQHYFQTLRLAAVHSGKIVRMQDSDVVKHFPGFHTADELFNKLMEKICGPI